MTIVISASWGVNNRVAKKETDYYKFHFNYTADMGNESTNFIHDGFPKKKIINDGHLVVEVVLLLVEKDGTACSLCLPMHAQPKQFNTATTF